MIIRISSYTWIGDFADPLAFLQMWTSESNLNEALYKNPVYDGIISDSLSATGLDRYKKTGRGRGTFAAGSDHHADRSHRALNLIDSDMIGGWFPNPLDTHPLKYIRAQGRQTEPLGLCAWISSRALASCLPAVPPGETALFDKTDESDCGNESQDGQETRPMSNSTRASR